MKHYPVNLEENQEFKGLEFKDTSFEECHFTRCLFINSRFSACKFRNTILSDCCFKNCSFDTTSVDGCRFQNTVFETGKVVGIDFHKCDRTFFSIRFDKTILMACNFSELKMKRAHFCGCKVKECYFNETQLSEADFTQADLEGTLFHHCDLSKADFRGAINYSINPQANMLKKAIFSAPEALSLLSFFEIKIEES